MAKMRRIRDGVEEVRYGCFASVGYCDSPEYREREIRFWGPPSLENSDGGRDLFKAANEAAKKWRKGANAFEAWRY